MYKSIFVLLVVCTVAVSSWGQLFLAVGGEDADRVTFVGGQTYDIAIVSGEKVSEAYDVVIGRYEGDAKLGELRLSYVSKNAGDGADYLAVESPEGYNCWSGQGPVAGEQFVFDYSAHDVGGTVLVLADMKTGEIIHVLRITVIDPVEPTP